MADDAVIAARAARKIEKAAAKAEAARRREERAAEPLPEPKEIIRHQADSALYAYLLSHEGDRLFRRLVEGPHYTSGTALQAVLVCEAIFGKRERQPSSNT